MSLSVCMNDAPPLVLPIRNNPVSIDGVGNVRGIAVTLSQPNQFFSMMPAVNQNNTFVSNLIQCDARNYSCVAEHGGVYSPPANGVRTNSFNSWNGTIGQDVNDGSVKVYYNDLMTIEGHDIPGLPFFSFQSGSASLQSGLAIGRNSSFLKAAIDIGVIPGKQWSFWDGDEEEDVEGHLILGGYDQNRVAGDFTTFEMDPPTALWIKITDIAWQPSSGAAITLLNGTAYAGESLDATIEPFADYMEIPTTVGENFDIVTNATIDPETRLLSYASRPLGSLVFTLSNNVVISVPSLDLFDHGVSYDSRGNINTTTYDFWVPKALKTSDYPSYALRIGRPFLARKYLVTDFDRALFQMADASQETGIAADIQPLCSGTPLVPTPNPSPTPRPRKSNAGAIGGGVGGGVGGLLLIGLIVFFVLRRRRGRLTDQQQVVATASGEKTVPDDQKGDAQQQAPPPRYVSGVPTAAGPVYVEKDTDTSAHSTQHLTATNGQPSVAGIGELPSPTSDISQSSQGVGVRQERLPQTYVEMPTERY